MMNVNTRNFAMALFGRHNGVEALLTDKDVNILLGPIKLTGKSTSVEFPVDRPIEPTHVLWRFYGRLDLPILLSALERPRPLHAGDCATVELPLLIT